MSSSLVQSPQSITGGHCANESEASALLQASALVSNRISLFAWCFHVLLPKLAFFESSLTAGEALVLRIGFLCSERH